MAEYIIQSETLDDIANAINAKTGGSSAMTPAEMVTEIAAIPSGGGRTKIYGQYGFSADFRYDDIPEQLDIELLASQGALYQFSLAYAYAGSKTVSVDIKCAHDILISTCSVGSTSGGGALKEVTCRESPNLRWKMNTTSQFFRGQQRLEKIEPPLDLSNFSSSDWSRTWDNASGSLLTYIRFVPNTAKVSITFSVNSLLSDESLVSIANGLTAVSKTLTLHTTPKAKLSTIVGTVSQVTDDTGTYDFFTADEQGIVTLLDFITNTKGWTVA